MSAQGIATRYRKWFLPAVFVIGIAIGLALSAAMVTPDPAVVAASPTPMARPTSTVTPTPEPTRTLSPTATATPLPSPTATLLPTETATPRPTSVGTSAPTPGAPTITPAPSKSSPALRPSLFIIGGVDFSSVSDPLTISYPTNWDRSDWLTLNGVDILISGASGANLRVFNDIGSWVPDHKIFVYADGLTGVPILSIHDGYWAHQALEAEPLRELIEGSVRTPYDLATIEANLERLRGYPVIFAQGDSEARFVVRDALRLDAETTNAYLYKPGRVSELFPDGQVTRDTLLVLICSARQPGESNETFPARFLILLEYAPA